MAKIGTMPTTSTAAPVAGVPHFSTKLAAAPKQRQNMLSVRIAPPARMMAKTKPLKPKPFGDFESGD